jgi:hypothetical protein
LNGDGRSDVLIVDDDPTPIEHKILHGDRTGSRWRKESRVAADHAHPPQVMVLTCSR